MNFTPINTIAVGVDFGDGAQSVGRLATRDRITFFEYERSFIERGLDISPFRLTAPRPRGDEPFLAHSNYIVDRPFGLFAFSAYALAKPSRQAVWRFGADPVPSL